MSKPKRQLTDVMHAKESPEARLARKKAEYEEEGGEYIPREKPKAKEESALARLGDVVSKAAGAVSRPWASLMDDDEEKKP